MIKYILKISIVAAVFLLNYSGTKEKNDFVQFIQNRMVFIDNNLYACKYETTNFEYQKFLNDLQNQNQIDIYNSAVWDTGGWRVVKYNQPMIKYYHQLPNYEDYPAVNISYQGAELFCNWLTELYNKSENRKFKEVKFRLPNEEEWMKAASGSYQTAIYPWGGVYLTDSKGIYLANFTVIPQSCIYQDSSNKYIVGCNEFDMSLGLRVPAPVVSYNPNESGIYNLSGNVSEMVSDTIDVINKHFVKGGSWRTTGYYLMISTRQIIDDISKGAPDRGFRYFMEIIKE